MKATPGALPTQAEDAEFAFEFKWDGFRALTSWDGSKLAVKSRNDLDLLARFPELARIGAALTGPAIIDGEICALDDRGRPSFSAMQQRGTSPVRPAIVYFIFDVLHLGRASLLDLTYLERRERLIDLKLADRHWQTPPHHLGDGAALLAVAKKQGLEGVLAKRATSRYHPGQRSADWIKVKLTMREEFLVCGYLPGAGANTGSMGSLILGYHGRGGRDGSHLVHAGNVGTGFTNQQRRAFKDVLDRTATARSPFRTATIPKIAVYAQPTLIAEVEFSEWTHDGSVRHPRFVGLRLDKPMAEVEDPRPHAAPAIRPRGRSSKPTRRSRSER